MRRRLLETVGRRQAELLEQVGGLARQLGLPAYLVGGAIRDALLGCPSLDLDVTIEGEVLELAALLAEATGARLTSHERFGSVVLELADLHLDVMTARREQYSQPGLLPVVEAASISEDLLRRDFTVNAMALRLDDGSDELLDPLDGCGDLQQGLLRGLHQQTFVDDPTRIIRAARYAGRCGWRLEALTQSWLQAAMAGGALGTVTAPRVWGELHRLLLEETAPGALGLLECWGALRELRLEYGQADEVRAAWAGAVMLGAGPSDRALAVLGLLSGPCAAEVGAEYALTAAERRWLTAASKAALEPPGALFDASPPTVLYRSAGRLPEAALVAVWARYPQTRERLAQLRELQRIRADIGGEDLQRAGYRPSPGFGLALDAALDAKLDHGAERAEQLRVARVVLEDWNQLHEL